MAKILTRLPDCRFQNSFDRTVHFIFGMLCKTSNVSGVNVNLTALRNILTITLEKLFSKRKKIDEIERKVQDQSQGHIERTHLFLRTVLIDFNQNFV